MSVGKKIGLILIILFALFIILIGLVAIGDYSSPRWDDLKEPEFETIDEFRAYYEPAFQKDRDIRKMRNVEEAQAYLESYYEENKIYPNNLEDLWSYISEKYRNISADDPFESQFHFYQLKQGGQDYVICTNFETTGLTRGKSVVAGENCWDKQGLVE